MKTTNLANDFRENGKRYLRLFGTGVAMGTADLIPGVSGGTIAFLSGIYEELLYSIKTLSGQFLRLLLKGKVREAIGVVPFRFLIPLGVGILVAVFSLARLLTYLLEHHPIFIWSFFFGLVLASTWVVLKRIRKWNISYIVAFAVSTVITYFVVGLIPVETPDNLPFFFLSGMIAICAMILPGISGSFILLLLGKYQQVLAAVNNRDFLTLGVFAAGCVLGLSLFSRVLSWLFRKHHDLAIAVLAGLMLGSVRKLWPWKETVLTRINSHGVEVPLVEDNIMPPVLDATVLFALMLAIIGAALVLLVDRVQLTHEHTSDIESPEFKKEHQEALQNQ
jgi:putative membrane protein